MSKRGRTSGGSVTGGTGDIKPQYFTLHAAASAADDYAVEKISLPVPRFGTMKTKATIVEVLSVDWYLNMADYGDSASTAFGFLSTNTARSTGETSTLATLVEDAKDPTTLGLAVQNRVLVTQGGFTQVSPIHVEMTDENGNGVLIATDSIFIVGGFVGNTAAGEVICKMKYRLVNVGVSEYVGIVQSQQ